MSMRVGAQLHSAAVYLAALACFAAPAAASVIRMDGKGHARAVATGLGMGTRGMGKRSNNFNDSDLDGDGVAPLTFEDRQVSSQPAV